MAWKDTKGDWSQRNQRREMEMKDQFGRAYHVTIEIKTGHPTGLIQPKFEAPLMPQQAYLEVVPDRPYDLYWNIDRQLLDVRSRRREWESDGRKRSQKMYGEMYDPRKEFSQEVLDIIGPPPEHIEPLLAAKAGNKYVLGQSDRVDIRLSKYFEKEILDDDFLGETGVDYSEIEEEHDPGATGGKRQDPRAAKPPVRVASRGTGERKGETGKGARAGAGKKGGGKGAPKPELETVGAPAGGDSAPEAPKFD